MGLEIRSTPIGICGVDVTATLETDATEDQLAKLGDLTERYCVVGQSLALPPLIVVKRA